MAASYKDKGIEIKIVRNDKATPPGKLADAEVHFVGDSPLAGLKLVGFSIWQRRTRPGRNVMFPSRPYTAGGERRQYALLRAIHDAAAVERLRDAILDAFATVETTPPRE